MRQQALLISALAVFACGGSESDSEASPTVEESSAAAHAGHDMGAAMEGVARHEVRGVIKAIDGLRLTIDHEAIGDYMPAMTMPFFLRDAALGEGLAVDDEVAFTIVVEDQGRHVIEAITKR